MADLSEEVRALFREPVRCPKCRETKNVIPEFGVKLAAGVYRRQSWCLECRSKANYYKKPKVYSTTTGVRAPPAGDRPARRQREAQPSSTERLQAAAIAFADADSDDDVAWFAALAHLENVARAFAGRRSSPAAGRAARLGIAAAAARSDVRANVFTATTPGHDSVDSDRCVAEELATPVAAAEPTPAVGLVTLDEVRSTPGAVAAVATHVPVTRSSHA